MDLKLIPLLIKLRAQLVFKFCVYIPAKGKQCRTKTLIDHLLWKYQTLPVNKNMLNYYVDEPDYTPPDFGWYTNGVTIWRGVDCVTVLFLSWMSR